MRVSLLAILLMTGLCRVIICQFFDIPQKIDESYRKWNKNKKSHINSLMDNTIVRHFVSKLNVYYGDNDKPVTKDLNTVFQYLLRFGYIDHVKRAIKQLMSSDPLILLHPLHDTFTRPNPSLIASEIKLKKDILKAAIKEFQRFMRLNQTGIIDDQTLDLMNRPRCGGKDMGEQMRSPSYVTLLNGHRYLKLDSIRKAMRMKRHALAGSKWKMKNLTYKVTKYPTKYRSPDAKKQIDEQFARALKFWSDVTPLTFKRLPAKIPSRDVIMDIRFETGEHGDGDPLDGTGKVLAHAFFPQYGGDAHFDDDEQWTIDSPEGSNLLMAATHELGHALGLDHSDAKEAIMGPIYPPYNPDRKLTQDDVRAIQLLYGSKTGKTAVPNLCIDSEITALIHMDTTSLFVFKEKYYWRIRLNDMTLDSDYPRLIETAFSPLKDNIRALFNMPDGSVYIFQDDNSYKFVDLQLEDDYPKKIKKEFPSLTTNVDAAVQLDGIIYVFKGHLYWQYSLKIKIPQRENPQPIALKFPGIPNKIDAVFRWNNQDMYFFKGEEYYRLIAEPEGFKMCQTIPPYPRKTALWWFGCGH